MIGVGFEGPRKLYAHVGSADGVFEDVLDQTCAGFAGWGLTLTYLLMSAALLTGTSEFAQLAIKEVTGNNRFWGILAGLASLIVFGFAINNLRFSMRATLILQGVSIRSWIKSPGRSHWKVHGHSLVAFTSGLDLARLD